MVLAAGLSRIEIFEAASLEEALRCPADTLDLLLLDIQLPGINGLEGIAPLKHRWPEAKILMVSAFHEADAARNALARGAQGFISKTETPDRMLSIIAAQLCAEAPGEPASLSEQIRLTPRQCEVLDLLCQGLSNKMIGRRLNLSENTVRGHVQAMLATLQVSSRSEAAFIARRMGLVS